MTLENVLPRCALLLALVVASDVSAQGSKPTPPGPWDFGATASLNLSQSAFSSNWSGGDNGSVVWVLGTNATGERQFSRTFNLSNVLQLAYGQTSRQVDTMGARRWETPQKSTDLVSFESVGRFSLQRYVDPYFSLRLDTQFKDQSSPIGDISFNPIKLKETAGIARVLQRIENSEVLTRLGFGFRQTFAQSFVDPVTSEKERFSSNDGGFEWQTNVKRPLLDKKVLWKATLLVFQPVFYSKSDALKEYDARALAADPTHQPVGDFWKATDVNFQSQFAAQITQHLSVNLYVQWVYDKFDAAANVDNTLPLAVLTPEILRNVREAGQFKETLALGLTYRLF